MGELKGHVGVEVLAREGFQQPAVLRGDGARLAGVADALPQQRRRHRESTPLRLARDGHELLDALARDETPRAEPHSVAGDAAAHERAVRRGEDCGS